MQINKENTNKSKFDIYQIEIWYDSILKEKKTRYGMIQMLLYICHSDIAQIHIFVLVFSMKMY